MYSIFDAAKVIIFRLWVPGSKFQVQSFWFQVPASLRGGTTKQQGSMFQVQSSGFQVSGFWFRVSGFRGLNYLNGFKGYKVTGFQVPESLRGGTTKQLVSCSWCLFLGVWIV